MSASIASVTVVFNAEKIIGRQMLALRLQSRKLEEIVVVDNGSTDGTVAILSSQFPEVKILQLGANMGVGGAFAAGLEYATKQKQHDWIWLLDDDSVPTAHTLRKLLEGLTSVNGKGEALAMLAPVPVHSDLPLSYPGLLWRNGWRAASYSDEYQKVLFVDVVISSGTLVRGDIVLDVGLPRSDFFMDFVDFEYCLRLRKHGYQIGVVRDSFLDHAIGTPRKVKLLGFSTVWSDHAPYREFYLWRNYVYTIGEYSPNFKSWLFVFRRFLRHGLGVVLFGRKKCACLTMMFRGLVDGWRGRLGIRFRGEPGNA